MPPADWGVGAHAKHLRNLYVYFWRWATWKVFDRDPQQDAGIVCFITVAGFLNGPGFQGIRDYLRRTADRVWVINCSPEGHQPDVPTRIFQGVQQPVCIVLAARSKGKAADKPATVKYTVLSGRETRGEIRGSGEAQARIEDLAELPDQLVRAVSPGSDGRLAELSGSMSCSRTTARASCPAAPGSSPRMPNRSSSAAQADSREGGRERGTVSPSPSRWEARRQTREQSRQRLARLWRQPEICRRRCKR